MFLFLLLAFMVVGAISLLGTTRLAWHPDCKDQADNFGLFAIGSRIGWTRFQSHVWKMAKAAGYCTGVPGGEQQAGCPGDQPWQYGRQESNVGLMRLCVPTSWSKRLRVMAAPAPMAQSKARHTAGWPRALTRQAVC